MLLEKVHLNYTLKNVIPVMKLFIKIVSVTKYHKFMRHSICEVFVVIFHLVVCFLQLIIALKKVDKIFRSSFAITMFYLDHWGVSADSLFKFAKHETIFVPLKENFVRVFLNGPMPMPVRRINHDKLMVYNKLGTLPFVQNVVVQSAFVFH